MVVPYCTPQNCSWGWDPIPFMTVEIYFSITFKWNPGRLSLTSAESQQSCCRLLYSLLPLYGIFSSLSIVGITRWSVCTIFSQRVRVSWVIALLLAWLGYRLSHPDSVLSGYPELLNSPQFGEGILCSNLIPSSCSMKLSDLPCCRSIHTISYGLALVKHTERCLLCLSNMSVLFGVKF